MEDERRYSNRYNSSGYRQGGTSEREYVSSRYTGNQRSGSDYSRERTYSRYPDRTPEQTEDYIRRRKMRNWKIKRIRILRRRIFFFVLFLIVILFVVFLLSFLRSIGNDDKKSNNADAVAEAEGKKVEVVDEPFVNILEKEGGDLTISWDGPVEKEMYDNMSSDIQESIDALTAEGYTAGFVLYDLNSGGGISYHPDSTYYSASAIKGPYVVWIVQEYPSAASDMYSTLSDTINWSSNSDYFTLINTYGKSGFNAIRISIYMYDYFMSGQNNADTIRDLYIGTEESSISETLGEKYTVYSKAGWIADANDSYYTVQNDAGVVMKEGHPYVLVLLSDAYGRHDLLDNLTDCLDRAHSGLSGLGYERPTLNTSTADDGRRILIRQTIRLQKIPELRIVMKIHQMIHRRDTDKVSDEEEEENSSN